MQTRLTHAPSTSLAAAPVPPLRLLQRWVPPAPARAAVPKAAPPSPWSLVLGRLRRLMRAR